MIILKKIKRTIFWKWFLILFLHPFYNFFWKYIINFHAKLLGFFWNLKKNEYFDLKNKHYLKVNNNNHIINLANDLSSFCTENFLERSRNKMKANKKWTNELFQDLPEDLRNKIIDFASSNLVITTTSKYLGVFPILSRIYFYHNIVNQNNPDEELSQKWHKDGMGYKGLDFFISVTDIDESNGPLFLSKKKNPLGAFSRIKNAIKNPKHGERNKISNEEFEKIHNEEEIDSIIGRKGTCLIVDSYNCYHKGGFVKKGERLMLRIAFDTVDSTVVNFDDEKNSNREVFYYSKKHKNEINNSYLRFLYFKRSKFIKKLKIPEKLLKFYQFFHYKINI